MAADGAIAVFDLEQFAFAGAPCPAPSGEKSRCKPAPKAARGKKRKGSDEQGELPGAATGAAAGKKRSRAKSAASAGKREVEAEKALAEEGILIVEEFDSSAASPRPAAEAEVEDGETPPKAKRKQPRYRQAEERDSGSGCVQVEVLCTQCRKSKCSTRQSSLAGFFGRAPAKAGPAQKDVGDSVEAKESQETSASGVASAIASEAVDQKKACMSGSSSSSTSTPSVGSEAAAVASESTDMPLVFSHGAARAGEGSEDMLFCSRCLTPMHMTQFRSIDPDRRNPATRGGCPLAAALKRYKHQAVITYAKWELSDSYALALMRAPCVLCGHDPDLVRGIPNGITRLRNHDGVKGMGPYSEANTATACPACNMMKGVHTLASIRAICRHIATHRGLGDFGKFPDRFVNNTSKRSRSAYLADHKTHALTNAQFSKIVEQPCHFCGKKQEKGKHYNGLDRLDNSVRVYTESTCVSCCGTCNMAKGRHSEALFLDKCRDIAKVAKTLDGDDAPPRGPKHGGAEAPEEPEASEGPESDGKTDSIDEADAANSGAADGIDDDASSLGEGAAVGGDEAAAA